MLTRRDLLARAVSLALAAGAPVPPVRGEPASPADPPRERLGQLLGRASQSLLEANPESATFLGIDSGERRALRSRLTDRSIGGDERLAANCRERLRELRAFDAASVSGLDLINLRTTIAAFELAAEGYDRFSYGDNTVLDAFRSENSSPYVVNPSGGFLGTIPDLLDTAHKVESGDDAESYLERIVAFGRGLDGETERLRRDTDRGVVAPDFVIDKTLQLLDGWLARPPGDWALVESLARRAREHDLPGDWRARAVEACRSAVGPALQRQADVLRGVRPRATHEAGVRRLPDGEAYYRWMLKVGTTTNRSPAEVHRLGLDWVDRLDTDMDRSMRRVGLRHGTVGERLAALGRDPSQLYPNDDAGRARLIAYLNDIVADMRLRLPRAFATQKKADLVVRRVPPAIEDGAADSYEQDGPVDGSAPAIYYINLRDTANYPKFTLPTLCYHEGVPGHVWQGVFVHDLPLIRTQLQFNAYAEGWALYAEQLGDELGAYDADPLGRIGYLQSIQLRACRLVLDTGLNDRGWSRERAIRWMMDRNGNTRDIATGEVERYCTWPGQSCGYQVGHLEFVALRERARAALGGRFDLRRFNDALLTSGSLPLTVLDGVIDGFIRAQR